jgi:hypothetical protein
VETESDNAGIGTESKLAVVGRQQECRGPTGRARTSKIARLPAAVREEINERLHDGEAPAEIVSWANGLPEVRKVLARHFASQAITEDNLARWRQGGYAGWLEHRATKEAVDGLAMACHGVDDDSVERLNRHISIVLSARLFVEVQKFSAMEEGAGKTAAWNQLVMAYVLLRKADFYGVKVRHDRAKSKIAEDAAREQAEEERPLSEEEKEDRINQIYNTGRFECHWNNFEKKWEGPGAAMRYEEDEVRRQVREEMERRYPNGFPAGYRPPWVGIKN